MATTGFGGTLSGSSVGSVSGIQSASIAGLSVDRNTWHEFASAVGYSLPGKIVDGVMTLTITYVKAIYDTLRDYALSRAADSWTYTCGSGDQSTVTGSGYISSVGAIEESTDGVDTFTLEIFPATNWTYTPKV